jgi:hypothetical protein
MWNGKSDECANGFHLRCHSKDCSCSCGHLPADPLERAVVMYNKRAPLEKWKPKHIHFDADTTHYVLFEAAKISRALMPIESALIYDEGKLRQHKARVAREQRKEKPKAKAAAASIAPQISEVVAPV